MPPTNQPSQKELNEFVLDLVEFLAKHFPGYFDKTRVAGGNEGVSVLVKRAASGSELEITTDRLDACIDFGSCRWNFRGYVGREELFSRLLSDLTAVFADRIAAVSGYGEGRLLGSLPFRDVSDAEALARFRAAYPACDKAVLKRWSDPETILQ